MRTSILSSCLAAVALGCSGGCAAANPGTSSPDCVLVSDGFGPTGSTKVKTQLVVSGLEVPWGIAFLPGGTDMLVTERPGRVRLVRGGALVPNVVANVPLDDGGESGLLGIVLHPEFSQNRFFYVYATVDAGGRQNRIERWKLSDDATSATFDRVIFGGIGAANTHDGGRLRIGPDGMLYASTGDAREPNRAQDPNNTNGKLLRLTLEGQVPQDNPISGSAAFVLGLRNVQGFDWFDAATLVILDHGPSGDLGRTGHDEVNVAKAGDNFGWPTIYGCGANGSLVRPRLTWKGAVPPGGAAIYRGSAIPAWKDSVLVGVLGSNHLHRVVFDGERRVSSHEVYFEDTLGRIREVISGPDGELYLTTSNCDGRGSCPSDKDRIVRIVPE